MERRTVLIVIGCIIAIFISCSGVEERVTSIAVPGMICKMCERDIRTALQKFSSVQDIDFDFDKKIVTIKHEASGASKTEFEQAIAALGYDANNTRAVPMAEKKCICSASAKDMPSLQSSSVDVLPQKAKDGLRARVE